ncbi:S8 family peptidase [Streptomyces sp. JJ36]|uniref:S8 family peptidase n=1 Tax=Streptomyces sp. JJ36 TaxID=2736645 RepID=UPI001F16FFDD|nr:S8 family peptidase [Streptomyces sp. JJ36]MCF6525949.1 S8 family peptidase [Streptomyces sp. JJ36]
MQHAKRRSKTSRIVLAGAAALVVFGGTAVGAGAIEQAGSGPELGEVRGAGAPGAIDGEYIVVLKDGAVQDGAVQDGAGRDQAGPDGAPGDGGAQDGAGRERGAAGHASAVRKLAGGLLEEAGASGAAVERTFGTALHGFAVRAGEREARRLAADPDVAFVEQNRVEYGDGTQSGPTWGLDRIDERTLPLSDSYTYDSAASGVTAYIVDSGIRIGHDEFEGRAEYGHDFVDDDGTANDCHGHGTHVAGTLGSERYGVAKDVSLVAVRVLNCENRGTTADVLAGYDWVAQNAVLPAVANVSIGGSASDAKDAAVKGMVDAGVTVTVSAGNSDRSACLQSPAREPSVLTVAASTGEDARWSSSNYGDCVDLFAPGYRIVSLGIDSDTDTSIWSGTSMAAPHVAGAAALYLADHPSATPAQVTEALLGATTRSELSGIGTGSPNRLLYSRF